MQKKAPFDRPDAFTRTFSRLGKFLEQFPAGSRSEEPSLELLNERFYGDFSSALEREHQDNPWFTREFLLNALHGICMMLKEEVLLRWLEPYRIRETGTVRTVGVVMAGNIPLVGFHDLMSILATGHAVLARPSSKDDRMIKKIAPIISFIEPSLGERIRFTSERLGKVDAVIATGSNNSARYFEYYFREIPHIIRKNRSGVAVLTGTESDDELAAFGEDIFTYFGLGCRNVTKIYVPEEYDLKRLLGVLDRYHHLCRHHKYANNLDYYRTIYLMNKIGFLDNGVLLLKEDKAIASPVGVVFYERYSDISRVRREIESKQDEIQCCASLHPDLPGTIAPGSTQLPLPWDYADGIDTIRFLTELK